MGINPENDRIRWHLEDMLAYAREAIEIHGGKTVPELESDRKTQLAVIRCLEILGEAANRVPVSFQSGQPGIPWKEIISTRHRLVHGYDSIALEIVQAIVTRELPGLIPKLESLLLAPEA
jgi:uncharacterized protein with HEPN domain